MGIRKERREMERTKHKMTKGKKILIVVLSIILVVVLAGGAFALSLLSKIKQTNLNKPSADNPDYVPVTETQQINRDVINIAMFGLDRRGTEASRSDTIMVLSLDKDNKKIKLTSLMRDMYVAIPGKSSHKINAAYAFGGPGLAINTINSDFNLDIKYYATVDFKGVSRLIDKLGGVDINVKQGEIQYANEYIDELNTIDTASKAPHLTKAGMQHLNGKQAVGYMRIRYYGDGDYQRTERQRTVLTQLFDKVKKAGILKLPDTVSTLLPYIETNMPTTEIVSTGVTALNFSSSIEQYRLPVDNTFQSKPIDGEGSCLVPDIKANTDLLHKFIYGDTAAAK